MANTNSNLLEFTGKIIAGSGKIAGWNIEQNYFGKTGSVSNTFFLSQSGLNAYWNDKVTPVENDIVGGKPWFMYFKGKFGVNTDGYLYANGADISGKITTDNITATYGSIDNCTLGTSTK